MISEILQTNEPRLVISNYSANRTKLKLILNYSVRHKTKLTFSCPCIFNLNILSEKCQSSGKIGQLITSNACYEALSNLLVEPFDQRR